LSKCAPWWQHRTTRIRIEESTMSKPSFSEADLGAILTRAGLFLSPDQVRALLSGAVIVQAMIDRVNAPLPREAELAVTFNAEQR
jgi:hypothetical protein